MTTHNMSTERCPIRRRHCPEHHFVHGKEAEELRSGIEEALDNHDSLVSEMSGDDARDTLTSLVECLRNLLGSVDARDSIAYVEKRSKRKKGRNR